MNGMVLKGAVALLPALDNTFQVLIEPDFANTTIRNGGADRRRLLVSETQSRCGDLFAPVEIRTSNREGCS
jgi:hypothetical protein